MKTESIAEQLASFTVRLDLDKVPAAVIEKLHVCIADALECCLNGTNSDIRTIDCWKYVCGGRGPSTAFGRGKKISAENAAFYNTVTGAVSSRNDVSKAGSCHAGSVVVPAVIALAEETGCSGKTAVEAILAGYETMIRLGIAMKKAKISGAFRSTAMLAPFGAAYAAAKVLGLNTEETCSAASFACHSISGFNNWVSEGTGEDVLQNAWGARNGVAAAHLAATGLPGAKTVLEDKDGVLAAFNALPFAEDITKDLGTKWHILDVDYKVMGSCFKLMAPCQGMKKLLTEVPAGDEIEHVTVGVADAVLHHAGTEETQVESQVQAIMSIPFGIANVIADGTYMNIDWYPPYPEKVKDLMPKVGIVEDPALTAVFPGKRGASLDVTLKSGKKLSCLQEDVEGLTFSEIRGMFLATAGRMYGAETADRLLGDTDSMEDLKDLNEMTALLFNALPGTVPEA